MAGKNTAAFGIFPSHAAAESAVDHLHAAGFSTDDVSVLMADKQYSTDFAAEKNTKAPEGTTAGVLGGGTIGGTLGLLAGLGALAIPGVGPLIAAGPIIFECFSKNARSQHISDSQYNPKVLKTHSLCGAAIFLSAT